MEPGAPVFIVGAPRSGTSILYRTLLKHPDFEVRGDQALALAESAILEHLPSAPRWRPPRPPRLWHFFLHDEEGYAGFVEAVRQAVGGMAPAGEGQPPPWTGAVLDLFVEHAAAVRGCRRLVEKTPTHIERAEWLLDHLPGARLLFIHRHPLGTYSSYLRRAQVDSRAREWADLTVDEFAALYRRHSVSAMSLATGRPERFMAIGYEAFTADPGAVTRRVCEFAGVSFQRPMIEEPVPDLARSSNDPHLFGEITPRTKSWFDWVDEAAATRLHELVGDVAAAWGYPPESTP